MAPAPVKRPTGAMILAIVGGIFILIGGLVLVEIGSIFSSLTFGLVGGSVIALGAVGALIGILTIVCGVLLNVRPEQHAIFGALILVFAIISWVTAFGGFFLGFLLALIGGILALVFKPTPRAA